MSNFPTSDPSFSAKTAGGVIQSAHINSMQDEIVAIGASLRGTAQHSYTTANSMSASSNLSVGGHSTLAGGLQVDGNSTFAGLITASAQPRCVVHSSVAQAIAAAGFTAISFEQEDSDVGGLHSTAVNPSRITIPAGSSGTYLCGATIRLSTGTGVVGVRFLKNSTTEVSAEATITLSSATSQAVPLMSQLFLDGTEWLEVQAATGGSTASTPAGASRRLHSEFWVMRVW